MWYALEDGKIVASNEDEDAIVEFIAQRLTNNPTVGARIELLSYVRTYTTRKEVIAHVNDGAGTA